MARTSQERQLPRCKLEPGVSGGHPCPWRKREAGKIQDGMGLLVGDIKGVFFSTISGDL